MMGKFSFTKRKFSFNPTKKGFTPQSKTFLTKKYLKQTKIGVRKQFDQFLFVGYNLLLKPRPSIDNLFKNSLKKAQKKHKKFFGKVSFLAVFN